MATVLSLIRDYITLKEVETAKIYLYYLPSNNITPLFHPLSPYIAPCATSDLLVKKQLKCWVLSYPHEETGRHNILTKRVRWVGQVDPGVVMLPNP